MELPSISTVSSLDGVVRDHLLIESVSVLILVCNELVRGGKIRDSNISLVNQPVRVSFPSTTSHVEETSEKRRILKSFIRILNTVGTQCNAEFSLKIRSGHPDKPDVRLYSNGSWRHAR